MTSLVDLAVEGRLRPRSFDVPGARDCIATMESWLQGEPVWPYAKILDVWGRAFMDWRLQWREMFEKRQFGADLGDASKRRIEREVALIEVRYEWIGRYGFAIPCAELLDALAKAAPIIEIAAGSGYMTKLMRHRGISVIGTDIDEMQEDSGHGFIVGEHDPWQIGRVAGKQAVRRFPERSVFCSWPTLHHTWFRQALRAMRIGQQLIVIREECCAESSAWEYLDDCFEERGTIRLPTFPGIHDYAGVYVKRRHHAQGKTRVALFG